MSAMRDIGTATSVDHICVPSGRVARQAQSACFRADHRLSISFSLLADVKVWQADESATSFAAAMLLLMASFVPENLASALARDTRQKKRDGSLLQEKSRSFFPSSSTCASALVDDLHLHIIH